MSSRKHNGLFIRRNGGPHRFFPGRFEIVQPRHFPRRKVVFEIKRAGFFRFLSGSTSRCGLTLLFSLLHLSFFALLFDILLALFLFGLVWYHRVLSNLHFKSHLRVFVHQLQPFHRQVLGVIREIRQCGERGGHLGVVPERSLGPLRRVYNVVARSLRGLVAVPEFVGLAEPVRRHRQVKHQFVHGIRQKPFFERIIGRNVHRRISRSRLCLRSRQSTLLSGPSPRHKQTCR